MRNQLATFVIFTSLSFATAVQAAEDSRHIEHELLQKFANKVVEFAHKKEINSNTPEKLRDLFIASAAIFSSTRFCRHGETPTNKDRVEAETALVNIIKITFGSSLYNGAYDKASDAMCAICGLVNSAADSAEAQGATPEIVEVVISVTALKWLLENADATLEAIYEAINQDPNNNLVPNSQNSFENSANFNQFQTMILHPLSPEARAYLHPLTNLFRMILSAPQGQLVVLSHLLDPQSAFSYHPPQNFHTDPVMCILYFLIAVQMQPLNLGDGCG